MKNSSNHYQYWGKASTFDKSWHCLTYHSLDVAACAYILLEEFTSTAQQICKQIAFPFDLLKPWLLFFTALHDIGKFSHKFQKLVPHLAESLYGLNYKNAPYDKRHDTLGFILWQGHINDHVVKILNVKDEVLDPWIFASTGHHGCPPLEIFHGILKDYFQSYDQEAAQKFVYDLKNLLIPNYNADFASIDNSTLLASSEKLSWWIAGFINLSDWLGSSIHFPFKSIVYPLDVYWHEFALPQAKKAIQEAGIKSRQLNTSPAIPSFISAKGYALTPLQEFSQNYFLEYGPKLFILEDVPGAGKTEAALILAHRLMQQCHGTGLFMALPTMATANGIYDRMKDIYKSLFDDQNANLVLAHSGRNLSPSFLQSIIKNADDYEQDHQNNKEEQSAAWQCSAWIADSAKKAFLADIGVGTIDQALLSTMPSKHQALKIFGLVGKVLIIDEVHSYDKYVLTLLKNLINFHLNLGGNVILLSASLPHNTKRELISILQPHLHNSEQNDLEAYPLATIVSTSKIEQQSIECSSKSKRKIRTHYLSDYSKIIETLIDANKAGNCILWIRNTVLDAIESYEHIKNVLPKAQIQLFHSRFTMQDRLIIENKVKETFGINSNSLNRSNQILIATQVVEQSLDLDFDVVISDLAPIDLIVQRAGRLQRHIRDEFGNVKLKGEDVRGGAIFYLYGPPIVDEISLKSTWYEEFFPRGAKVYRHHGQLWLTANLLHNGTIVSIPSDIRNLIEEVYSDESQKKIPKIFERNELKEAGKSACDKSLGIHFCLEFCRGYRSEFKWERDENIRTRLGEPTSIVRLVKYEENKFSPWSNHSDHPYEMSEVRVAHYIALEANKIAKELEIELEKFTQSMPDKGKGKLTIPLFYQNNQWIGSTLNNRQEPVQLIYTQEKGLTYQKEDDYV